MVQFPANHVSLDINGNPWVSYFDGYNYMDMLSREVQKMYPNMIDNKNPAEKNIEQWKRNLWAILLCYSWFMRGSS